MKKECFAGLLLLNHPIATTSHVWSLTLSLALCGADVAIQSSTALSFPKLTQVADTDEIMLWCQYQSKLKDLIPWKSF